MKMNEGIARIQTYGDGPIKEAVMFDDPHSSIIYRGDAKEIIEHLLTTEMRADMICTDPAYLLTSGGNNSKALGGCLGNDQYNNSGHLVPCNLNWSEFMPLLYRIMKSGHAYVMSNNRNVRAMLNSAHSAKFKFHNLLVWRKQNATPNRWYMKNCEFTGMFYKGKAFKINDCSSKSCVDCPNPKETEHPTEKPVPLMEAYINNSTKKGGLVLDPFMGSGTTGVAAIKSERKFIGIESEKKWFDIAIARLSEECKHFQTKMF